MNKRKRKIIHSLSDIPLSFPSEDEEREWWADHELSEQALNEFQDLTAEFNARHPIEPKEPRKRAAS